MTRIAAYLNRAWLGKGPLVWLLMPLSGLMALLVAGRHLAYRQGWLKSFGLPVPVIVVGNRVVGGAGKTPTTIALLAHLQAHGWRPGVLSRGYKAALPPGSQGALLDATSAPTLDAHQTGDEPMLIWRRTGVPVMIGRDRVAGGQALLQAHPEIDIVVCDDGLQHLRLRRDVDIIVFDGRGAGNGYLLPAGPLREPIDTLPSSGLVAPALVLYNAAHATTRLPGHISRTSMAALRPLTAWWQGQASDLILQPQDTSPKSLWALAGIAHPQRFFDALRQLGFSPNTIALDDHADFSTLPWPSEARDLIVTEKDAVKLDPELVARERPGCRVWVAALDLRPEEAFWRTLDAALAKLKARHQPGR